MIPESIRPTPLPLFEGTFALYRVSPLFTGDATPPSNASLIEHAQRLREILAKHYMYTGPQRTFRHSVGALDSLTWETLPDEEARGSTVAEGRSDVRGILLTISYEKMSFWAILLQEHDDDKVATRDGTVEGFHHYPLLLLRMPATVRLLFTKFLEKTFDTRISSLHLSSKDLMAVFERYVGDLSSVDAGAHIAGATQHETLSPLIKDAVITLGFSFPDRSTLLKTIEIQIQREDLAQVMAQASTASATPFFTALAAYLKTHLALDLWTPQVKIVRIKCGNFLLAAEGHLRLPRLPSSARDNAWPCVTQNLLKYVTKAAMGDLAAAAHTSTV
ncbi:hypothetical protein K3495_g1043 [Podosphaera aphanis]|nr:hypothetical protein K3495_g1043 [Podosphaera aphanis]